MTNALRSDGNYRYCMASVVINTSSRVMRVLWYLHIRINIRVQGDNFHEWILRLMAFGLFQCSLFLTIVIIPQDDFYVFDDLAEVTMSRMITAQPIDVNLQSLSQMLPSSLIRRWERKYIFISNYSNFISNVKSEAFLHMLASNFPDIHAAYCLGLVSNDVTQDAVSVDFKSFSALICIASMAVRVIRWICRLSPDRAIDITFQISSCRLLYYRMR